MTTFAVIPRTAKIVVGNSVAGDTVRDCDYLDSGNGTQLNAAIVGASSGQDVYIRPGTYDVNGLSGDRLLVPSGVAVRGSGYGTVIRTRGSGDQGAFALPSNSSLSNLRISVRLPTGAGTGDTAVVLGTGGSGPDLISNVTIEYEGTYGATEAGNLNVTTGFESPTLRIRSCKVSFPGQNINALDGSKFLVGYLFSSGGSQSVCEDCRVFSATYGMDIRHAARVQGFFVDYWLRGLTVTGSNCVLTTGYVETFNSTHVYGVNVVGGDYNLIQGLNLNAGVSGAATVGVRLDATSDRNVVSGCKIAGFDTNVSIAGTNNLVLSNVVNVVDTSGTPITDTGTGTSLFANVVS